MAPRRDPIETFGVRVKERRLDLGLTQEELAERANLHYTYVGQIERGLRNLTLRNILRVAQALELDAGDLMRGCAPDESAMRLVTRT